MRGLLLPSPLGGEGLGERGAKQRIFPGQHGLPGWTGRFFFARASLAAAVVPGRKGGRGMTDFMAEPCEQLVSRASWEAADIDEESDWDLAALDPERVPALARHFHILDLQHWLDLCA